MNNFSDELRKRKMSQQQLEQRLAQAQKQDQNAIKQIISELEKIILPVLDILGKEEWGRSLFGKKYKVRKDKALINTKVYHDTWSVPYNYFPARWILTGGRSTWHTDEQLSPDRKGRHRVQYYTWPGYSINVVLASPESDAIAQEMGSLQLWASYPDGKKRIPETFVINYGVDNIECGISQHELEKALLQVSKPMLIIADHIWSDVGVVV